MKKLTNDQNTSYDQITLATDGEFKFRQLRIYLKDLKSTVRQLILKAYVVNAQPIMRFCFFASSRVVEVILSICRKCNLRTIASGFALCV